MKLVFCPVCLDIFKMKMISNKEIEDGRSVACNCGRSWGRYIDLINAEYGGDAIPIDIHNRHTQQ